MEYVAIIGIEVHAEMSTQTKAFCSCANVYGAMPNTHVCPMCLGLPGGIPSINRSAVEKTIMTAMVFESDIASSIKFERKNYFYPDLPKGYQIVQYNMPIGSGGRVVLSSGKAVEIDRIHMEEDTAKMVHGDDGKTYIDFNRSGVPIVEIVCKPTIMSCDEAVEVVQTIRQNLLYAGVSHGRMERGELRFDINISLSCDGVELGTRVELINLLSASDIKNAIDYEIDRQTSILNSGEDVLQETRAYSHERGNTYVVRKKENVRDYRHVADPDLKEIVITPKDIRRIKKQLPETLPCRKDRYKSMGLEDGVIDILTSDCKLSNFFDAVLCFENNPHEVSKWIVGDLLGERKESCCDDVWSVIKPEDLAHIISLVVSGQITRYNAKLLLKEVVSTGKPATLIVREKSMIGVVSENDHWAVVDEVIETNPNIIDDYKNNKEGVINYIVGESLELSGGRVNIDTIKRMAEEKLR